jgi:hypothetical protein
MYWRTWVPLAEGAGIFLHVPASIYDLRSGIKRGSMKLIVHPQIVPEVKNVWYYTSL